MKNILILTTILVLAVSNSFAADVASTDAGDMSLANSTGLELHAHSTGNTASITSPLIGKCSTGVGVGWKTDVNGYALITQHKSGTKAYGSSYDSTALYVTVEDGTPGTVILSKPGATDTTDFVSGTIDWRKM